MAAPIQRVARTSWRAAGHAAGERAIPEETAVAFTYNGSSYAVMMATPQNLEDFAVGFSITEGVIESPGDIEKLDIVEQAMGIELRMWLKEPRASAFIERRRHFAGPTGCGLCGLETLSDAMRSARPVADGRQVTSQEILRALEALAPLQTLNRETRAVHAAAFWKRGAGLVALREDVGRHNALDKLAGALARDAVPGSGGIVLVTSRVSVEMVQKASAIGTGVIVAISAPTALAVRTAEQAGMTLIAIARDDGFEIFTNPQRVAGEQAVHVA